MMPLNWDEFISSCFSAGPLVSMFSWAITAESTSITSYINSLSGTFCNGAYLVHYLFKFVSRQPLLYRPESQITTIWFCSDLYYLGLSNDPLYRKALVYGVYAAELAQTILYSKKGFQEFASGFGNILALQEIGLLWFAAPVLTAIGVFNPFFGNLWLLTSK